MKIGLFLDAYTPYKSGVVTSVDMLKQGLEELGYEVFIFSINFNQEVSKTIIEDNLILFNGRPMIFKGLKQFKVTNEIENKINIVKKYDLDIIHLHTEYSISKIAVLASKRLNIPLVYTFHTLYEDTFGYFSPFIDKHFHNLALKGFNRLFLKKPIKQASAIIIPTKKVEKLKYRYGIKKDCNIIPTGIFLDKFKTENELEVEKIKEKYDLLDKFIFLSLGRISEEKSLDKILSAFDVAHHQMPNAVLIFVGNGPYLEKLRDLIKEYHLEEKVILTGEINYENVPLYFKAADIMVNASTFETQGLTNIESLASGKPILVKKDEAIEDLVVENENGFIFDTPEEFVAKMIDCYNNLEKLRSMEEACVNSVEKFSIQNYARNVLEIYHEVLEK